MWSPLSLVWIRRRPEQPRPVSQFAGVAKAGFSCFVPVEFSSQLKSCLSKNSFRRNFWCSFNLSASSTCRFKFRSWIFQIVMVHHKYTCMISSLLSWTLTRRILCPGPLLLSRRIQCTFRGQSLCLYDGRTLFAAGIAYVTLALIVSEPGRCNSISFSIADCLVLQELCSSTVCEIFLFNFQNLDSSLCQRIANSPSILFEVFHLILSTYSAVKISLIFLLKQQFLLQYRTLSSNFRVTWLLWEL